MRVIDLGETDLTIFVALRGRVDLRPALKPETRTHRHSSWTDFRLSEGLPREILNYRPVTVEILTVLRERRTGQVPGGKDIQV